MSKFQTQIQAIFNFRSKAEKTKSKSFRTGKGLGLFLSVFNQPGFKPTKSLQKTLRKHTNNLRLEGIKAEQRRDIALIKTPGTFAHRQMYNRGYVDEYGNLLKSRQKVLMNWANAKNKIELNKAYFNLASSPFNTERDLAKYLVIRNSSMGIDIELTNRYVNMLNTIDKNFDENIATKIKDVINNAVNGLTTNDRRWFLAMLDTGQNGFSVKVIYQIANQGKPQEQLQQEILAKFEISLKRTKNLKGNKRFTFTDLIENTKHN